MSLGAALTLLVTHDGSHQSVSASKSALVYKDMGITRTLKIEPCNRELVEGFLSDFHSKREAYNPIPASMLGKHAVSLSVNGSASRISPGSEFGKWLRGISSRVNMMFLQAAYKCGK